MLCETKTLVDVCLEEALAEDLERRRLHRKPFLRRATITRQDRSNEELPAFCRDLSREGVGLLHSAPLPVGVPFTLSVPLLGQNLQLHCETSWCEQVDEQSYFSGSAYDTVSTPRTLVLLSAVLSDELHRRLHRRYPLVRPAQLTMANGATHSAFCRDVSQSGIGFISRQPIEAGMATVSICLPERDEVSGQVDIRRCDVIGQNWFSIGGHVAIRPAANCTLAMNTEDPADPMSRFAQERDLFRPRDV